MNENQRKWLLDLQSKGVKFEICSACDSGCWIRKGIWDFIFDSSFYRIPAQPIPDIPDWREVCWGMQDKGVKFKMLWGSMWNEGIYDFEKERDRYQLIEQPIPEWKEEMTKETKLDPREEIPHRELQIQWHEDMLHHLRTGEPMRAWEVNYEDEGYWKPLVPSNVSWSDCHKYRRKPRTVKYWHCVAIGVFDENTVGTETIILGSVSSRDDLMREINCAKQADQYAKFSPITETIIELEG